MTPAQIAELRRVAEAATPGPRFAVHGVQCEGPIEEDITQRADAWTISTEEYMPGWETDNGYPGYGLVEPEARFHAAASPTTILSLLAERDALVRVAEAAKTHDTTRFLLAAELAALAAVQEKPDAPT